MKEKIIKIPFDERDKYIDVILELNQCVSRNGAVQLWTNHQTGQRGVYLIAKGISSLFRIWSIMRRNNLEFLTRKEVRYLQEAVKVDYSEMLPLGMEEKKEQIYQYLHAYDDGGDGKRVS